MMNEYWRSYPTSTSSLPQGGWVQWWRRSSTMHAFVGTGKTQVWNGAGIKPPARDALEQIARAVDPRPVVWKGPKLPVEDQDVKGLGTSLGHPQFLTAHLERITEENRVLFE